MNLQRKIEDLEAAKLAGLDAELDRLCGVFWQRVEEVLTPAQNEALRSFWRGIDENPEREPAPAAAAAQDKIEATPETAAVFGQFLEVFKRWYNLRSASKS